MEELADQSMPEVSMVEFNPLLDSSDMGPGDWVRIGQVISRFL